MKGDELGKASRVNAPNAQRRKGAKAQRRKGAKAQRRSNMCRVAAVCTTPWRRTQVPIDANGRDAVHRGIRQDRHVHRPQVAAIRRMRHSSKPPRAAYESPKHSRLKPRHTSCSYVLFVSDVVSGLVQIVSHTSTQLVAKARALEARDQDLDRNLDTLPGRHPGGRHGIDEFVSRAIDERADRGTG